MPNTNISPEERLFNVIQEGNKLSVGVGEDIRRKKVGRIGHTIVEIKQFFFNLRHSLLGHKKADEIKGHFAIAIKLNELNIRGINIMLGAILFVCTSFVVHYGINKKPSIARITQGISFADTDIIHKHSTIEPFKPLTSYLDTVEGRDIFRPVPKSVPKITHDTEDAMLKLKEISENFKVKGISWGISPKVMLMDNESKVYFLRQEQTIGTTGVEIKAIYRDKVILSYEGAEMELL